MSPPLNRVATVGAPIGASGCPNIEDGALVFSIRGKMGYQAQHCLVIQPMANWLPLVASIATAIKARIGAQVYG
jgi:hypothetical protein